MERLYSQSTGCCYLVGIHGEIPADAVPISDELYQEVIANPAPNTLRAHKDGLPYLIPVAPDWAAQERAWRDGHLTATEWLVNRHRDEQDMQSPTTLSPQRFAELLVYRQALRDWPQSGAFPESKQRPVAPSWLAGQAL